MSGNKWKWDAIEVLTVGLPFCAFKVLTGYALFRVFHGVPGAVMGWALVGLGFLDLLLNLNNLVTLVVLHRRTLSVCTLALVTDRFLRSGWDELGVATDVLLSFSLVALMVGGGFLPALGITGLWFWNLCVVLNVMGAGISRMASALRGLREEA